MTVFDPKQQFTKWHPGVASKLRDEHQSPWFVTTESFALLQMAASGCTAEEMLGAKMLIQAINNLAADEEQVTRFPKRTLPTFEMSPEELAKLKPKTESE